MDHLQIIRDHIRYEPDTGKFFWKTPAQGRKLGAEVGGLDGDGYRRVNFYGKRFALHRLAWFFTYGVLPPKHIDHINRDRADNRLANLRLADHKMNSRNRSLQKNNTSGVNGVSWDKNSCVWQVHVRVNRKKIFLGRFTRKEDAIKARQTWDDQHGWTMG